MLKVELLAVGTRPPGWVEEGIAQYQDRMKRECHFSIKEVKTADRKRPQSIVQYNDEEADRISALITKGAKVIAMDRTGENWRTEQLATKIQDWSQSTNHFQFLIGGPDGLARRVVDRADATWSLSNLTFPHFLVRVLLSEQIYRALMVNANHPYHK